MLGLYPTASAPTGSAGITPNNAADVLVAGVTMVSTSTLYNPDAYVGSAGVFAVGAVLVSTATIAGPTVSANTPEATTGYTGARSLSRTLVVHPSAQVDPGAVASEGTGTFWDTTNPSKPTGVKDPQSVIDVSIDWSAVLTDCTDQYDTHSFTLSGGLVLVASGHTAGVTTAFVAGGAIGRTASITFQLRTASNPARVDERTLYLKIRSL